MSKAILDADEILQHASPVVHQKGHEIQPFGHLVRMPIALGVRGYATGSCVHSVCDFRDAVCERVRR